MPIQLRIALRYIFASKSTRAIQVITWVSMLGMCVGTAALVLVLSVFNGFEDLAVSLYDRFYPDIKITPAMGKVMNMEDEKILKAFAIPGIAAYSAVLEEKALLKNDDQEYIATLKGVDEAFSKVTEVSQSMYKGRYLLEMGDESLMVIGAGIAQRLKLNVESDFASVSIYLPKRTTQSTGFLPDQAFTKRSMRPAGSFSIQQEFDFSYALIPLDLLQSLMKYPGKISAWEIALEKGYDDEEMAEKLQDLLVLPQWRE
jgi:lipoprotein-releasing system permease protein